MTSSSNPYGLGASPQPAAEDGWDVSPRLRQRIMTDNQSARPHMPVEEPMPRRGSVLTPAEIEMLLRPDLSDMDEIEEEGRFAEPEMPPEIRARSVPELPPEPAIEAGREEAARRIAARLSRSVREHCGLQAAFTLKHVSPSELASGVSAREERGQAIVCFSGAQGDISAMLVIGAGLAQLMVETACGGPAPVSQPKLLSPIDLALLEGLTRPVASAIAEGVAFAGVETDPLFAASIAAPGAAYELIFSVRAGGADWPARLLVAKDLLAEVETPVAEPREARVKTGLTVLLTARVASVNMPLSKLTSLRPGATLLLGVPADQPVELLTGDHTGDVAAEAEIGRKGNRMALRITRRGPALRSYDTAKAG